MTGSPMDKVLNYPSLPSLPGAAVRVLELTRNPKVSMNEIAQVVSADPALVAKVLKTVNSSYYGLSQPCPSISRAMSMLGMNTVKSIVLGFSLVDFTKTVTGDGQAFDIQTYWRRAIYSAAAARAIALRHKRCDPEEAFVGALIADIGMLASYAALKEEYVNVLSAAPEEHDDILDIERTALGFDHTSLGRQLGAKWRLPAQLVECIGFHHAYDKCSPQYEQLLRTIHLGQRAATVLSVREPRTKLGAFIVKCREWYELDRECADALLEATSKGASDLAKSLELKTGDRPDVTAILAEAQDALVATQLEAQQQSDELRRTNEELERKTITDALTGAFNRARFDKTLAESFEHAKSKGTALSLLFFDADKFKSVNDTLGHAAGDAVLKELSKRTRALLGKTGTVCRYGGEEFAIILPHLSISKACKVGELLRSVIARTPFDLRGAGVHVEAHPVTISIGVSGFDAASASQFATPESLTQSADEGVYAAKKAGRNRVCLQLPGKEPQIVGPVANTPPSNQPASPAQAKGKPATLAVKASNAKRSLLIVEDDPLAAKLLEMLFSRRADLGCSLVHSAEAAFAHLNSPGRSAPDMILCDMQLPGMTGVQFIKHVQAQLPALGSRIIIVSSLLDETLRALAYKGGAALCINKAELCSEFDRCVDQMIQATSAQTRAA